MLIIFGENQEITFASFLMIFVALLDCVDGNVARARGETGPAGEWMDAPAAIQLCNAANILGHRDSDRESKMI